MFVLPGLANVPALKRVRIADKEDTDNAVRAAAMLRMRARLVFPLAIWSLERDVTRKTRLVEEYLDDVRKRAQQRGWAPLAQHWKPVEGVPPKGLASAAMQPYLRRWAAADEAAAAAVEAAAP